MERKQVESSCIRSVGYDSSHHILEIEFTSGSIYQYMDVPLQIYFELMSAVSKGKFFHQNVSSYFSYYQIDDYSNFQFSEVRTTIHSPVSNDEIKLIHRKLVFHFHPDRNKSFDSEEMMKYINCLYDERNFDSLKRIAIQNGISF